MGWNTVVLLYNNQMNEWEQRMAQAARMYAPWSDRLERKGHFGYGQVVSVDHAYADQVVVAGDDCARRLSPIQPVQRRADLDALANVLRGHGYSVKAPGEKRAKKPFHWGYAAKANSDTG